MATLAPRLRPGFSAALLAIAACAALAPAALASEVTFHYTGKEQTFNVPVGVYSLQVEAVGARGGTGTEGAAGGNGAVVKTSLSVLPGNVFYIAVGANGNALSTAAFNGGGMGAQYGAGGGGATDLRTVSMAEEPAKTLGSRILVAAGGGGGGGGSGGAGMGGAAEVGGGNGANLTEAHGGHGGGPGTASAGGTGGSGGAGNVLSGEAGGNGALAVGGQSNGNVAGAGGGGGGGLYGGGAGGTGGRNSMGFNAPGGGGGGGSNLVPAGGAATVSGLSEEPHLTITYSVSPPTAVLGSSVALSPESALLLGSSEGFIGPVSARFEYGTSTSYGFTTPESSPAMVAVASALITKLKPGTTYHYRLLATRSDGATTKSPDGTVTTPPACLVPNLKGKKLKAARKALTKADCKLGKIKGEKSKSAKVIKQNPKPGKVLAPGAQVNVKLTG